MKYTLTLLLLALTFWVSGQNLISPITITLPPKPPANTADWANAVPPVMIMAQTKPVNGGIDGMVIESKILVTIKSGGNKVCGSYTPQSAPNAGFNSLTKSWNGANVVSFLGQDCSLKPGSYELCVQFYNYETKLIGEACKPFTIADNKDVSYSPPNNVMPFDKKEFTEKELLTPITFRWTPIIPKPQDPIVYRLRVWQLMTEKGNTSVKALMTTDPIFEKDVENTTQIMDRIVFPKSCPTCKYYWTVEALMKSVNGGDLKSVGTSAPTSFSAASNQQVCRLNASIDSISCTGICYNGKMRYSVKLKLENTGTTDIDFDNSTNYNAQMLQPAYVNAVANVVNGNKLIFAWVPGLNNFGVHNSNIIVNPAPGSGSRPSIIAANSIEYSDYEICTDSNTTLPITLKIFASLNADICTSEISINTLPTCPLFCCENNWISKDWYNGPRIKSNGSTASLISLDSLRRASGSIRLADSLGEFPCGGKIGFKLNYNCNRNCGSSKILYIIYQLGAQNTYTINSYGDFLNNSNMDINCPNIAGEYAMRFLPICGDTCGYKGLSYRFIIKCSSIDSTPSCCKNSSWGEKYFLKNSKVSLGANNSTLGTFSCKDIIPFTTNYNCAPSCSTAKIKYELYQGMVLLDNQTVNAGSAYNLKVPNNTDIFYTLNITAICDGKVCNSWSNTFMVKCDTPTSCCQNAAWESQLQSIGDGTPKPLPAGGGTLGTVNCGEQRNFKMCFICPPNCGTSQIKYEIFDVATNAIVGSAVMAANCVWTPINMPSKNGSYKLKITPTCGNSECSTTVYTFKVLCPDIDCCKGGKWETKGYTISSPSSKIAPTAIECGKKYIVECISGGNISFNANYICNTSPTCKKDVFVKLVNGDGEEMFNKRVPVGFDLINSGNYKVTYYAKCGDKTCDSCTFDVAIKSCPPKDCCADANWADMVSVVTGAKGEDDVTSKLPACGSKLGVFKCNEIREYQVCFSCPPNCGAAAITYQVLKGKTVISKTVVKTCEKVSITSPSTAGDYALVINASCNDKECKTCTYYFSVKCDSIIDCCNNAIQKDPVIYDSLKTTVTNLNCKQPKAYYIIPGNKNCDKDLIVRSPANCGSTNKACFSEVKITLTNNNTNATISGANVLYIPKTLENGTYTLIFNYMCGGVSCKTCEFDFVKDCSPPIDCCKGGKWITCNFPSLPPTSGSCPSANSRPEPFAINASAIFNYSYACNGQNVNICKAKLAYQITSIDGVNVMPAVIQSSGVDDIVKMPSASGRYCIKVYAYCGESTTPCDSCTYCFSVICTDCKGLEIVDNTTKPNSFQILGTINSTKIIKQVTAQLVSFSADRKLYLPSNPKPNFEFLNTSSIGGAMVSMPYSLTSNRSTIAVSNFTTPSTSVPFKLIIADDVNKRMKSYRIKFTIFYEDGTYCEYKDIQQTF
jgi:hypothetical protein